MTPSNGNPKPTKLHPDDDALFGWLDDETLKKKRRRSTSSSSIKSSKADGSKNTTQAKINDIIITTTTTSSSSNTAVPSSFTGESHRLKTVTPTKLERQHILLEFEKAFPKTTLHVHHQQQKEHQQQQPKTKSSSSHDDKLEECLANACNSHFLQLAPDYDANKKKLKKAAHNGGTNNKAQEPPEKQKKSSDQALDIASEKGKRLRDMRQQRHERFNQQQQLTERKKGAPEHPEKQNTSDESQKKSSDKALDIASKKGKRVRDKRQQRHEQHNQQQQLAERKRGVEYWIRNTPLNGNASRSFDLLPGEPLKHVASYLAAPSRALFDVALNGDKHPDDQNRGVAGDQFDILDFGEIEKSLAIKLRDRHLKAILLRIDAVNSLKRLRLTNCVEIKGDGLVPLRGSRVIEQIDLSIVSTRWKGWNAWQDCSYSPIPQILSNKVQPILDSIIEREGCSLKHLLFSKASKPSVQFWCRYKEMLWRRNRPCQFEFSQGETGLQHRCYGCLNHFCGSCRNEEQSITLRSCNRCAKYSCNECTRYFCSDCTTSGTCTFSCSVCRKVFCKDCDGSLTDCYSSQCDQKVCSDCISANKCNTCKRFWCKRCSNRRNVRRYGINGAKRFQRASRGQCASCFLCSGCHGYASPDCRCKFCNLYFCGNCFLAEGNRSDGVDSVCLGCSTRECLSCENLANPDCHCIYCNDYFCENCFGAEGGAHACSAASECFENDRYCASCGDHECNECECCEQHFCDECLDYGTMCVECKWAMPLRSRPERHVVYGDAFTSAPIIRDAFLDNGPDLYNGNGPDL